VSAATGWRRLDWDSAFWGFEVGSVVAEAGDLAEAAQECDEAGIECSYLLLDAADADRLRAAQGAGWRYVDTRIELRREAAPPGAGAEAPTRTARGDDLTVLEGIAREAFAMTRFHVDTRFDRSRADELYATWVRERLEGDGLVVVADAGGAVAGFMAGRLDAATGEARHELIGVAPAHRGTGLGGALSDALSRELREQGAGHDGTATQAANLPGLRMFGSRGFEIESFHHWLHRWRP
jgi:ribosomal protein S18 acetylase RimI-like enzyme